MSFDVKSLANRKNLETQHDEVEWMKSLESARQSLRFIELDYEELKLIALACRSPEKFTLMTRLIYQYGKSHPKGGQISSMVVKFANDSPFSLPDWIDTIDHFHAWLVQGGRKVNFLVMLKYLECCVASPDAREGGQTFVALVDDMLNVYGYEG